MSESGSGDGSSRSKTVRDVLIFQAKLWLEGFKDVVLMPLSLGAALIDLFGPGQGALYSVMRLGDRFERWVHLYAALDETESTDTEDRHTTDDTLDSLLNDAADGLEKKAETKRSEPADRSRTNP